MDEVNGPFDGIHEPMDEVIGFKWSNDVARRRAFPIGSHTFETMDDAITLARPIHDNHGFIYSPSERIGFIHGHARIAASDKRHPHLLTFSINERIGADASYAA